MGRRKPRCTTRVRGKNSSRLVPLNARPRPPILPVRFPRGGSKVNTAAAAREVFQPPDLLSARAAFCRVCLCRRLSKSVLPPDTMIPEAGILVKEKSGNAEFSGAEIPPAFLPFSIRGKAGRLCPPSPRDRSGRPSRSPPRRPAAALPGPVSLPSSPRDSRRAGNPPRRPC